METLQKQTSLFGEEELTSLRADFRANHTAQQGNDLEKQTNAIYGQKCLEQYERYNHATSWGKMFMDYLIGMGGWYSTRCKLTWKMKGTKYNRLYFQLVPLTLRTGEKESSLWPTPTSVQRDHPERVTNLIEAGAETMMSRRAGENRPNSILDMAMFTGLIPTPCATDYKGAYTPEKIKRKDGKLRTDTLKNAYLMTGETYNSETSQLNPRFVMEMMGFPPDWTELPFLNGDENL